MGFIRALSCEKILHNLRKNLKILRHFGKLSFSRDLVDFSYIHHFLQINYGAGYEPEPRYEFFSMV